MTSHVTRRSVLLCAVAAIAVTAFFADPSANAGSTQRQPADHLIEITGFKFLPARLEVRPGDTITWINNDIIPHTATARDGSWTTKTIGKGEKQGITVKPGMAPSYVCRFHPAMRAQIVILPS